MTAKNAENQGKLKISGFRDPGIPREQTLAPKRNTAGVLKNKLLIDLKVITSEACSSTIWKIILRIESGTYHIHSRNKHCITYQTKGYLKD